MGLLVPGALILAWAAGRMLIAALFALQAEAFLADFATLGGEPAPQAWEVAYGAARGANDWYPVIAGAYLEPLAKVLDARYAGRPVEDPEAGASRRLALEVYRHAAAARPLWPWAWAQLAHAKLQVGERDAEFFAARERAGALGPWRPSINRFLVQTGFALWPDLDATGRRQTLEAARRLLQAGGAHRRWAIKAVQRQGRSRVQALCILLIDQPDLGEGLCQR